MQHVVYHILMWPAIECISSTNGCFCAKEIRFMKKKEETKKLHKKSTFDYFFLASQFTDFFAHFNFKFSHVYYTLYFQAFYLSFSNISVLFISLIKFWVLYFNKIIIIILIITSEVTSFVFLCHFFRFFTIVAWFFVCLIYSCQCAWEEHRMTARNNEMLEWSFYSLEKLRVPSR